MKSVHSPQHSGCTRIVDCVGLNKVSACFIHLNFYIFERSTCSADDMAISQVYKVLEDVDQNEIFKVGTTVMTQKKKADHSREANKAYRVVKLGCQDAFRPLPDGTHQLKGGCAHPWQPARKKERFTHPANKEGRKIYSSLAASKADRME